MIIDELITDLKHITISEQKNSIVVKLKLPWGKQNIEEIRVENNEVIIIPRYD